ncbi:MAG TPA: hypothetical protein VEY10_11135 [Flavisolibacter sp.]|nr:hypothetical protein [Flavisolibacter sp.]
MQDENGSEAKALVADANKIEYTHHGPTVASQYNRGYAITISPHEMVITIKSYSKILLTVKRPFTRHEFNKILTSFKDVKEPVKSQEDKTPVGGSSNAIVFYKDKKVIFKGDSFSGYTKKFSNGDIGLSYVVDDLEELIERTRKKDKE